ncbi:hypothetical protein ABH930_006214 [Kitasatospora sp. GAS204A]|uniref:hypothetical protein n=1 Tax=unclassified Kitasatospora TaxID=2633591 RepID=UPI002474B212|nr:hypothetical protein [Kitasatospora sp. GAS204B]MDH6120252.1 hypothetical protein [Kitasatospora sp. GAS204B]
MDQWPPIAEDLVRWRGVISKSSTSHLANWPPTERTYNFAEYDGSRSLDEFALEAARPARPRIEDITTDELVEIIRRLLAGGPESDYYLRLLEANVAHPRVSDLIFQHSAELPDASAEQIVDEALKYRPIAL